MNNDFSKVTIVLPSLNPDDKLNKVVDGLLEAGFKDIVLVNDGSDVLAVGSVRFLLNERSDGQDLIERVAGGLDILHDLIAHLRVEVVKQS